MSGNETNPGLMPRTVAELFRQIEAVQPNPLVHSLLELWQLKQSKPELVIKPHAYYLEIYNEEVFFTSFNMVQ